MEARNTLLKTGGDNAKIPVVSAMSLLTGIGEEETLEEIVNYAKE